MNLCRTLLNLAIAAAAVIVVDASPALAQDIRKAPDIVTQVANLKFRGDPMGFRVPPGSLSLSGSHHWQGLVRHPDPAKPYFYAASSQANCTNLHVIRMGSTDAKTGYRLRSNRLDGQASSIFTAPNEADRVVNTVQLPDTHAGGMQAAGKYLAIPLGDHVDADCINDPDYTTAYERIGIYDISNPANPFPARIFREWDLEPLGDIPGGIGEVAIVQRDNGTYYLISVKGDTLYGFTMVENAPTAQHPIKMTRKNTRQVPADSWPGYSAFQSYQLINPLGEVRTDGTEVLYLMGLRNTSAVGVLDDYIWLYKIVLDSSSDISSVEKISERQLSSRTAPESPDINGNFAAGASAWISPTGALLVYSSEHFVSGLNFSVTMTEYCDRSGDFPATVPTDGCTAQVFLYTEPNFEGKSLTIDALDRELENINNLFIGHEGGGGFSNNVTSVTWRIPVGANIRLYNGINQNGDYLELTGAGSISDLRDVGWTSGSGNANDKIESIGFLGGAMPAPVRFRTPETAIFSLNTYLSSSPCSMLKLSAGDYPAAVTFNRRGEIRSTGGLVRIGPP